MISDGSVKNVKGVLREYQGEIVAVCRIADGKNVASKTFV